jgi:D-alanyl-D-alanine endopeptidase (penicillin-binding protein 7)
MKRTNLLPALPKAITTALVAAGVIAASQLSSVHAAEQGSIRKDVAPVSDTARKRSAKATPQPPAKAAPRGSEQAKTKAVASKTGGQPAKASPRSSRKASVKGSAGRASLSRQVAPAVARAVEPARPSIGQAIGLHAAEDPLDLKSSVALVIDQSTGKTLFEKNSTAVLPIASITKLMTAVVVQDAKLPGDQLVEITQDDVDTERNSRSRLRVGSQLTRNELLQLALMASENRAAHALGRAYPGGLSAFVAAMNAKAKSLGMVDSHFVEPTGLSSANVSTGSDLALLVKAAGEYPKIREFSTAPDQVVEAGQKTLSFRNTNRLIASPDWTILVSKTGYISEAGNCLVMQAKVEGRAVILVLLDAVGKLSRFADAQRLRTVISRGEPGGLRPQTGSGS